MKNLFLIHPLLLAGGIISLGFLGLPALAQDADKVQELQRVIEAQQKQLDEQRQLLQELQTQIQSMAAEKEIAVQAPVAAEDKKTTVQSPVEKVVTSGGRERVRLAISGQVNRAANIVDDGKSTEAYFVDNDNSESRVRFVGTARATDDLTIGSKIELSIPPNKAGEVDQNNQETNNVFDQRWTEVSLDSKRFGKTAFGVDYTQPLNLPTGRDEGYSIGAAAVQQFEEFGTEIYLLFG
jgi:hypothetical protein